jgi:riboflavin biosynthesis pyrimidine reductase
MQTMAPPDEVLKERFARIDERFDGVDAKFARVNERLVDVDRRIAETSQATNHQLKEVDRRIAEMSKDTDRRLKEVDRRVTEGKDETNRQFKEVNRRIDANTAQLELFRQEISAFHSTFQRGNYILIATIVGAILTLLVEGGGQVHGSFMAAGLADEVALFVAPKLIGAGGVPFIGVDGPKRMADAWRLGAVSTRRLGDDILVVGDVLRSA